MRPLRPFALGTLASCVALACAPSPRGGGRMAAAAAAPSTPVPSPPASGPKRGAVDLPIASHARPLPEGPVPVVAVVGTSVTVDDRVVADASVVTTAGRLTRLDGLFEALKARREQFKATHPGEAFPGVARLDIAKGVPAVVVKSVFQTVAFAGYPSVAFGVHDGEGSLKRLDVDAIVPGPPNTAKADAGARLLVVVRRSGYRLAWQKNGKAIGTGEVASADDLAARIREGWARYGEHRDANDRVFDQVILHVDHDVDHAAVVGALDAIASTPRDLAVAGRAERVPALKVNLSMSTDIGNVGEGDPLRTAVNGRLPPEVIQRIVRANEGRHRTCYEQGLAKNPALAGRVSVRFVIGDDGAVAEAADGGSSMPDPAVVACVVKAMSRLTFPRPQGGKVTVVYPFVFGTDDTPASDDDAKSGGIGLGNAR